MYNYTRLPVSGEGKLFCPCWQAGERIQMRSQMNQALFQRWVAGAVSAVVVFAAGAVSAEDIALNNPSFELPAVPFPTDPNPDEADFVLLDIDGWDKTGPFGNDPRAPVGVQDTGVFINVPFDPGTGELVLVTDNADGNQLAFMVVNTDSFLPTEDAVTISQTTGATFEAGKSYTFKIDLGVSVVAPPSAFFDFTPGGPVNPETLELIIGYGGGSGDTITEVAKQVVSATELALDFGDGTPQNPPSTPLTEFEVSTGFLDVSDDAIGENLRIMIRQVGGNSGAFNIDNARLSSVPERGSLAILGLMGGLVLRRRR